MGYSEQFAYTVDGQSKVTQTDVTDPKGNVRRVTFNTNGYALTDTRVYGTAVAQTTTYTRVSIRLLKAVHTATHPAATLARSAAPPAAVASTGLLEGPAASLLAAAKETAPPYTQRHGDRAESGA